MTKKANVGTVVFTIFIFLTVGVVLYAFNPTLLSLRAELLTNLDTDAVLEHIFAYSLMFIIWGFYFILGAVFILVAARGGE